MKIKLLILTMILLIFGCGNNPINSPLKHWIIYEVNGAGKFLIEFTDSNQDTIRIENDRHWVRSFQFDKGQLYLKAKSDTTNSWIGLIIYVDNEIKSYDTVWGDCPSTSISYQLK